MTQEINGINGNDRINGNKESLKSTMKELGFKTPFDELPGDSHEHVHAFLKTEMEYRRQHKIKSLLKLSGIRQVKTLNRFDWGFNPRVCKEDVLSFLNSPWIEKGFNLVLIGDTGLGKSHIASSLCYEAVLTGHGAVFISAYDLISRIHKATNREAKIEHYGRVKVLCIDELGYTCHKKEDSDILFQIISKRSEALPTIVTTNLPPKDWGSIFSGAAASAILDRLSYNGRFITFEGRSYRLLNKQKGR